MAKTTPSSAARGARNQAQQSNEIARLAKRLDNRYEKTQPTFQAVSAGRNQVQINGGLYPAEGVEGQGGAFAVVNVGTPSVARYAASNRRSVVAVAGTGRGGSGGSSGSGGSGATTLDELNDVLITGVMDNQVLVYSTEIGQWRNEAAGAASMITHDLSGPYHTGLLDWARVNKSGSSLGDLATREHSQLNGIGPDDHHAKQHNITDAAHHTITGLKWQVVGATANNVLGLLTPTHMPGETETLLKTDATGSIYFDTNLLSIDAVNDRVGIGNSLFLVHVPNKALFFDTDLFVLNGVARTMSVGGTLFQVDDAFNTVAVDIDLFKINANSNVVSIDTNLFVADANNRAIGINRTPSGAALDIIAPYAGLVHTQRIKQLEGQTGRMWRVENTEGDELIVLDSVGNLQSGRPGFVSGMRGWQITPGGNAEFNNIWARGELHASVFVKDEVHATGGTLIVSTAGKLHADAIIDSSTSDTETFMVDSSAAGFPGAGPEPLTIETTSPTFLGTTLDVQGIGNVIEIDDPPSGPGLYFQPGEILRVKTEINEEGNDLRLSDLWLEVMEGHQEDGYSSYSVVKRSGSDCTIPAGTAVVSYKKRGEGLILLTSDWRDDEGYSPYMDVFTTGMNPWDADDPESLIPHVRLGQLKGIGLPGVSGISQWGMIAGTNLTDANSGYLLASNEGIVLYKTNIRSHDGTYYTGVWQPSGSLILGKNIATSVGQGFRFDAATGDIWIGGSEADPSENYLWWQANPGVLHVKGSLSIGGEGDGFVTESELATAITDVYSDSTDYEANRRVTKVAGTWSSTGANSVSWSLLTLYFAKGPARTVAAGSRSGFTERQYVYVKWTDGTGPLTFIYLNASAAMPDPDHILIAVFDIGNPTTAGTFGVDPKASVNVVAGGVYISGGNIFAQAIRANHIVNGSIETAHFSTTNKNYIDARQTDAQIFSNRRRVASAGHASNATLSPWGFGARNSNTITWTSLQLRFGDGSASNVSNGSVTLNASYPFTYLYVSIGTGAVPSTLALNSTVSISTMGANDVMVAVCQPAIQWVSDPSGSSGSGYPSLTPMAGQTFISGDQIMTGTIITRNLAANAIEAGHIKTGSIQTGHMTAGTINGDRIAAGTLNADAIIAATLDVITANTGNLNVTGALVMGNAGKIYSANKGSYADNDPGFWIGYDAGAYKFNIGSDVAYLKFDGGDLHLRTKQAVLIRADSSNVVLAFADKSGGAYTNMTFTYGGPGTQAVFSLPGLVFANYFEATNIKFSDPTSTLPKETMIWQFASNRQSMTFDGTANPGMLIYSGQFSVQSTLFANYMAVTGPSGSFLRLANPFAPASAGASGNVGEICWSGSFLYVCIAPNSWRRASLSTF